MYALSKDCGGLTWPRRRSAKSLGARTTREPGVALQVESNFASRAAGSVLGWAVAIALVRLVFHGGGKPLVDILAVAIIVGVAKELMRLRRLESIDSATRWQAVGAGLLAVSFWAVGIWLGRNSVDGDNWVFGVGVLGVAFVVFADLLRGQRATPQGREPGT